MHLHKYCFTWFAERNSWLLSFIPIYMFSPSNWKEKRNKNVSKMLKIWKINHCFSMQSLIFAKNHWSNGYRNKQTNPEQQLRFVNKIGPYWAKRYHNENNSKIDSVVGPKWLTSFPSIPLYPHNKTSTQVRMRSPNKLPEWGYQQGSPRSYSDF